MAASGGIQLSTAGVTLWHAVETTAGERPTTGYQQIHEIKSVPELNPEPDNLETTTLEEVEWKTYVPGLKDPGGALSFTANLTEMSMNEWEDVVDEFETAKADNKGQWFCIRIPGLTKSLYFKGQPSPMGMPGMEVSAVLETNLFITPTGAPTWAVKFTEATGASEVMATKSSKSSVTV